MEPVISFVLALWPLWLVLAAVGVCWWLEHDTTVDRLVSEALDPETDCGCDHGMCCGFCRGCCFEEREQRFHGDDSFGR